MARKKVKKAKSKKTNVKIKRQATQSVDSMEKAIKDIPTQLRALVRKDIATVKQQESKLHATLQKMQKQQKVIKNKHVALSTKAKGKSLAATAKKQLSNVKKAFDMITQGITKITKELTVTKSFEDKLSQKEAKYAALGKHIIQFNKDWNKNATKAPTKPTKSTKAKTAKKPIKKPRVIAEVKAIDQTAKTQDSMIIEMIKPETADITS